MAYKTKRFGDVTYGDVPPRQTEALTQTRATRRSDLSETSVASDSTADVTRYHSHAWNTYKMSYHITINKISVFYPS